MRCNRCGNPLDPRDTRCAVYGKVLVPPTKKQRPPAQKSGETQHIKLPQLERFTHAYSRDAARSHSFHTATLVVAAVALVLLILVNMKVGDLKDAVSELRQSTDSKLAALQQTPVTTPTEAPVEDATEPPVATDPAKPLSQQRLKANVSLHRHAHGTYAAASQDLGTFEDEAKCWVVTNAHETHVQWTLTNAGDRLELQIVDAYTAAESKLDLKQNWSLSGDTFALLMDSACSWECRMSGGEWGAIPAEYVAVESGTSTLTLTAEALDLLMAQYDEMELRCQFTLKHPDGGSVTVTADGMTVTSEGLVTFANKPG